MFFLRNFHIGENLKGMELTNWKASFSLLYFCYFSTYKFQPWALLEYVFPHFNSILHAFLLYHPMCLSDRIPSARVITVWLWRSSFTELPPMLVISFTWWIWLLWLLWCFLWVGFETQNFITNEPNTFVSRVWWICFFGQPSAVLRVDGSSLLDFPSNMTKVA